MWLASEECGFKREREREAVRRVLLADALRLFVVGRIQFCRSAAVRLLQSIFR